MGWIHHCVAICIWSSSVLTCVSGENSQNTFHEFVDKYWDWRMEQSPEFATKCGSTLYADRWQSLTEEAFLRDKNKAEEFLSACRCLSPAELDEDDDVTYHVIQRTLQTYISGYKYRKYTQYNMLTPMGYPFNDWKKIIGLMPTQSPSDYDNFIWRYRRLDEQVSEIIRLLRVSIKLNTTQHSSALTGFAGSVTSLLVSIDNKTSFFHQPLYKMPAHFTPQQTSNITDTMTSVIERFVKPVIMRFGNFVEQEYAPNTRSDPGVHSLPGGQQLYQACLNWHLGVTLTAQQVHDMGLSEVERIENNIQQLVTQANFTGTMLEYLTYLKTLPENYYTSEAAMLDGYRELINSSHAQLYKVLPDTNMDCPIIVEQQMVPQHWASYRGGSAELSLPGAFVINVFNPETRPTFGMTSLTLHEAEPGHHTQHCYMMAKGGTRKGRQIAFRKYFAVPFNFPFFTSYCEGWALYAESLGEEMGVYDTSNKLLGRYLNEIFRAARLVVDTGIHAFGWSKQRAIDYLAKYTTRCAQDIENEVNRYISWPGQACAYKVGELKIRELRETAENKLGVLFDKRYFHHEILKLGDVPLSILEEHMNKWVEYHLSPASGCSQFMAYNSLIVYGVLLWYYI